MSTYEQALEDSKKATIVDVAMTKTEAYDEGFRKGWIAGLQIAIDALEKTWMSPFIEGKE
jgi:hypothetical protein